VSTSEKTLVEYYNKKLVLLHKLSWNIPEEDKINIVISGICNINIRQLAFSNNYKTLEELLTFLRSRDFSAYDNESKLSKSDSFKILCYICEQPGHKKVNFPSLRKRF